MNGPFRAEKHQHKDGSGLTAFQIHRLWQQVFVDRYTYGIGGSVHPEPPGYNPPSFTREQLRFLAGAVEEFGMICYDAGFYCGQKIESDKHEEIKK